MTDRTFVLVGHCRPDAFALRSALQAMFPGSQVHFANSSEQLDEEYDEGALFLVNRLLDGSFAHETGIELISTLEGVRSMLISNFDDAQEQAVAVGAHLGFGKTGLYADETRRRIETALGNA